MDWIARSHRTDDMVKETSTSSVGAVMTDLSKAFDCIPHDLLIAKLEDYGLSEIALSFIFSYLTNRNQCVCINDKKCDFQKIISGVPQGSITRPILFNFSINDLFFFVQIGSRTIK